MHVGHGAEHFSSVEHRSRLFKHSFFLQVEEQLKNKITCSDILLDFLLLAVLTILL